MPLFTESASWVQDEHRMFGDSTRRFMDDSLAPNAERWNEAGIVDRKFWNEAGEGGFMGGSVEEEYGGSGGDMAFDTIVAYEQARTGDAGWGFGVQSIVVHYIRAYASEEQKKRWLPGLVSGKYVGAIAMSEPGCGSDLQAVATTAVKDGNQYTINGSKTFITNGQHADLVIVVAKTDKDAGAKGTSLIMVETDKAEGFTKGRNLKKLGMESQDTSELFFENVKTPQTNLLGSEEGQGFYQLMKQLPWERLLVGVGALGAIDCALSHTLDYVKERKAFGNRIMDFQNTRFKLAEAKTKTEIFRSFVNDCIGRMNASKLDAPTASMAKYWGSQIQNEIIYECLQLFGGYGFMMEYPIARMYRDARVQTIYAGTNEIMKELIARSLDD